MSTSNKFDLIEKQNLKSTPDSSQMLNFKVRVNQEFYQRWTNTMNRLSKRYDGGAVAVVRSLMVAHIAELELLASDIPFVTDDGKAGE